MSSGDFMTVWAPALIGAIIGVLGTVATTQWLIHHDRKREKNENLKSIGESLGKFYFACNGLQDQDPDDWLCGFNTELNKCTVAISTVTG